MQNFWLCLCVTKSCDAKTFEGLTQIIDFFVFVKLVLIGFGRGGIAQGTPQKINFSIFSQKFSADVLSFGLPRQHLHACVYLV